MGVVSDAAAAMAMNPRRTHPLSDQFLQYVHQIILDTYNLPDCEEISVEGYRDAVSARTFYTVVLFGYKETYVVSDLYLNASRDSASWIASMLVQIAGRVLTAVQMECA